MLDLLSPAGAEVLHLSIHCLLSGSPASRPCLPARPVEHSVRDPLLSPAAAKLCELSWSILERGMLFIFILCIFCLGLLITFVPQERQLPQ